MEFAKGMPLLTERAAYNLIHHYYQNTMVWLTKEIHQKLKTKKEVESKNLRIGRIYGKKLVKR
jgi:hypothetical protein